MKTEHRLTTLEVSFDSLRNETRAEFKELKENHIFHLNRKLNWILGLFVSSLITLIFLLLDRVV